MLTCQNCQSINISVDHTKGAEIEYYHCRDCDGLFEVDMKTEYLNADQSAVLAANTKLLVNATIKAEYQAEYI